MNVPSENVKSLRALRPSETGRCQYKESLDS
jgi:hypothetical protein